MTVTSSSARKKEEAHKPFVGDEFQHSRPILPVETDVLFVAVARDFMIRTKLWLVALSLVILPLQQQAKAQTYGIELHNNVMPASGGMGGTASAALRMSSRPFMATRPR